MTTVQYNAYNVRKYFRTFVHTEGPIHYVYVYTYCTARG